MRQNGKEGATPHIETPQPPILHFGVKPSLAMKEAAEWADQTKDPTGRKYRIDGLCLAAGGSFPADAEGWPEYRDEAIEWLKTKYGDNLKSVVEHRRSISAPSFLCSPEARDRLIQCMTAIELLMKQRLKVLKGRTKRCI